MKLLVLTLAVIPLLAKAASAGQPILLNDEQLDRAAAGSMIASIQFQNSSFNPIANQSQSSSFNALANQIQSSSFNPLANQSLISSFNAQSSQSGFTVFIP